MVYTYNDDKYEIKDSNFDGPAPRGAYAISFAVRKKCHNSPWGISQYSYEDCWVVMNTVLRGEDDECNQFYKWNIVKAFGESQLEMAKSFKQTLISLANDITIESVS